MKNLYFTQAVYDSLLALMDCKLGVKEAMWLIKLRNAYQENFKAYEEAKSLLVKKYYTKGKIKKGKEEALKKEFQELQEHEVELPVVDLQEKSLEWLTPNQLYSLVESSLVTIKKDD